ncbi:MAG: TetR/AcrR family transcriptional regulator C-terminal domain-containing protein, partial [Propioniciclava sp.]
MSEGVVAPGSAPWWDALLRPATGRGRPPMPVERIVAAGLAVLDGEASEEYSIRGVASRLGSSTATLYRRVDGRPGLDALVVDAVLGEVLVSLAGRVHGDWQSEIRAGAETLFAVLERHPRVVALIAAQVPRGPNSVSLRRSFIDPLLDAGFAPWFAARTYTSIAHYTLGFGLQRALDQDPASEGRAADSDTGTSALGSDARTTASDVWTAQPEVSSATSDVSAAASDPRTAEPDPGAAPPVVTGAGPHRVTGQGAWRGKDSGDDLLYAPTDATGGVPDRSGTPSAAEDATLVSVGPFLAADLREEFLFGLDMMLRGIAASNGPGRWGAE